MNKKQKKKKWDDMSKKVDKVIDKLGMGIDKGIKKIVIVLNLLGFMTDGSCEGHIKWGRIHPWVDVSIETPKNWLKLSKSKKHSDELKFQKLVEKRSLGALKEEKRMKNVIDKFYKKRKTSLEIRLMAEEFGYGFTLKNINAELIKILPATERKKLLKKYQNEMSAFADFLEKEFFNK